MLMRTASVHRRLTARLRRDDRGATAAEYALLVGLIAAVIIGVVAVFGGNVQSLFAHTNASMNLIGG